MKARRQLSALHLRNVVVGFLVEVEYLEQPAVTVMREAPRSVLKEVEVDIIVVW